MRELTPHLHLVDYCSWIVAIAVFLLVPTALLTSHPLTAGATLAAIMMSLFTVGCVSVILARSRSARRLSKRLAIEPNSIALPFDQAQIQVADGSLGREVRGGCALITSKGLQVWEASTDVRTEPVSRWSPAEMTDIATDTVLRFGCYPLLVIRTIHSETVRVRLVNGTGPAWRIGMTKRQTRELINRAESIFALDTA